MSMHAAVVRSFDHPPRNETSDAPGPAEPPSIAMMALLEARADRSRALDWIRIGAMAGPTIELPSVALRSASLRIQGNGQGAVSPRGYLAELPSLVDEIDAGTSTVAVREVPLADVESAWNAAEAPGVRTVLVPGRQAGPMSAG